MILQQFIEGQPAREIRIDLLSNRPTTLDDAVQKAISMEAAYHIEASRGLSLVPALDSTLQTTQQVAAAASIPQDTSSALLQALQSIERKLDNISLSGPQGQSVDQQQPHSRNFDQHQFQQRQPGTGRGRGRIGNRILACFFCKSPDHLIASCPELERLQALASRSEN